MKKTAWQAGAYSRPIRRNTRCVALLNTYDDAAIGFVDASIAAIAERLKFTTIRTTDRRHFSNIRGKDGNPSTLLP